MKLRLLILFLLLSISISCKKSQEDSTMRLLTEKPWVCKLGEELYPDGTWVISNSYGWYLKFHADGRYDVQSENFGSTLQTYTWEFADQKTKINCSGMFPFFNGKATIDMLSETSLRVLVGDDGRSKNRYTYVHP